MTTTDLIAYVADDTEEICLIVKALDYRGAAAQSVADKAMLIREEWRKEALSW